MKFLDRESELERLSRLEGRAEGGLAVLVGRRRIGKTRLLLEWAAKAGGLYTVADESAPEVQRRYFAEAVSQRFPGFGDVDYPDWGALLVRLARDARAASWRGPLVFDELPYLVAASPELPSVLQRWLDHEAKAARLVVAVAGSSQRMMQGLVLSAEAPLFGRAHEILHVGPIDPRHLPRALGCAVGPELVEAYTAWGGVPRYWELAADLEGSARDRVERLALDPLGPLHREPDRLLQEEIPAAQEVRPVLDAIGSGVHRVSEIGRRLQRPATSMSRPLNRLTGMGLVRRETPFGESERRSRRALYKIDDPFVRLWFRVVAPQRAALTSGTRASRMRLLNRQWPSLVSAAWEELCRLRLPRVRPASPLGRLGPWGPASRWWHGDRSEWDLVAESEDGSRLLLGEVKWRDAPVTRGVLTRMARDVRAKAAPDLPARYAGHEAVRAVLVPSCASRSHDGPAGVLVGTARDLLG